MTPHPPTPYLTRAQTRRRRRRVGAAVFAAAAVFAGIGIAVSAGNSTGPGSAAVVPTGEISEMGMPVVAAPGSTTGTATAGPVEVIGSLWELGTVPLDVAVRPTWTLHNTGTTTVQVGEPHPEVRAGCCPGAFAIDTTTIEPGATAELSFELSMHAGMDGWHDIAVHVPLTDGSDRHSLELGVTGDFTNT